MSHLLWTIHVVFSNEPSTIFELNNRDTIDQLAHLAREAYYPKGGTRTDLAINRAIEMFRASSGDNADSGIPKLMTIFTDGQSDRGSNISGAVDEIRNNKIKKHYLALLLAFLVVQTID